MTDEIHNASIKKERKNEHVKKTTQDNERTHVNSRNHEANAQLRTELTNARQDEINAQRRTERTNERIHT